MLKESNVFKELLMKTTKRHIILFLSLILLVWTKNVVAKSLVVEGHYQAKDVYVENPISVNGIGYSVKKVIVNGDVSSDEINSSAFIIDLSIYDFTIGDEITIEIEHEDNNLPFILNPEALQPLSTFEITEITLDNKGRLTWTSVDENGSLAFRIEQFRWNKWVTIGEVQGKGTKAENTYTFKVDLNSGRNKVRVSQKDYTNNIRRSDPIVAFRDTYAPVRFIYNAPKDVIVFNENTRYEIFNEYGVLIKKGYGSKVDLATLKQGSYFVNYDNVYDTIQIN